MINRHRNVLKGDLEDLSNRPEAYTIGPALDMLPYFPSDLVEMIQIATKIAPRRGIIYVDHNGNEDQQVYPELLKEAGQVLGGLRSRNLKTGDQVVLQIENDRLFILGFWGSLLGGFIPVPLALPNSFPIAMGSEKITGVCKLLDNAYILTDQSTEFYNNMDIQSILSIREIMDHEEDTRYHKPQPDDVAYIQFSSGSTGDPKGVILTHTNLVSNIYAIIRASANEEEHRIFEDLYMSSPRVFNYPVSTCSWLPYSHDMGLIGFHLTPLAVGMLQIKMMTSTFVVNPTLNILLVDKYRVTQIPSPNFGLLWMLYMVKDEIIRGVDLSCVEVLYNGAEPISPTAVRLFINRFSQYGFNPKAMFPVYGMAEATLLVTAPPVNTQSMYHLIDRDVFTQKHIVADVIQGNPSIEFVDEGYPAMGMEIRIVDNDEVVKEGVVGHVQVRGPHVTRGYYKNVQANEELFCEGWLRTGDLGFIKNGRLSVTGRHKDIIFINGQNFYSHDIEEELQLLPFVGFKNMAICGVTDHEKGSEKIVLFIKTKKAAEELQELLIKINENLGKKIRVGIDSIVPMHDIPRTTSGKVQRFLLRDRYEAGDFRDHEVGRMDSGVKSTVEHYGDVSVDQPAKTAEVTRKIDLRGITDDLPLAIAEGDKYLFLPMIIKTLPDVLKIATIISPQSGILHVDENGVEHKQTYAELLLSAERVLGGLRSIGMNPGDQVILQIENSQYFLAVFWGIVLGGFVPVPLPIPGGYPISEGMERITKVCSILERFCIVTDQAPGMYRCLGEVILKDAGELLDYAPDKNHHKSKADDIAYLQFSSGSTGDPKGVILTHSNLINSIDASARCVLDVRGSDFRPTFGFGIDIIRRKLNRNKNLGIFGKAVTTLSRSALGDRIYNTKAGKLILDTLLIFSGSRISAHMDIRVDDIRIVNWMPYSHDMGLIGFHLAPTLGGMEQVKLEPKTFIQNPALFLRLIDRYRATHVPCPNFGAQWLTSQVRDEEIEGIDLSCIKALFNGSEPISPTITRDFLAKFSRYGLDHRAMFMAYGMAEASLQVTASPLFTEPIFHKVDKDIFARDQIILPSDTDDESIELVDVGAPVAGMKIRIVDNNDQVVHENVVGHIQIQGPHVVQGYYRNPEANKDLFCEDWLRTGDMGFLRHGRIVITGRRKDIIFVNGQNLYAHDIEDHIKRVPGMAFKELAISGMRHYGTDSEKIVLFIKGSESRQALASMLSRINSSLISGIGIKIDLIVFTEEIPRTPSGKVKRFKLRELFEQGVFDSSAMISVEDASGVLEGAYGEGGKALNEVEMRLLVIWCDVIGIDEVGKYDNFFELGGNSLRATKVASRIREEFEIELPLRAVFENQTIESLAIAVENMTSESSGVVLPPIEPLDTKEYYDVSHAQKRLWFLDKVIPESPFYNIPGAVLLENIEIDLDILQKALQSVVDRHETLRTTFGVIDEMPVQFIAEDEHLDLQLFELSHNQNKEENLQKIIEEEKITPFNLEAGPLLRTKVVKLSDNKHAILITMHHIISDGWSMGLLIQEALSNYLNMLEDKPVQADELRIQYKDFAHWQNQMLESEEIKKQETYWLDKLQGELPVLSLPYDRSRPTVQTQNGSTEQLHIERELVDRLWELARKQEVTPFMLTLAIFNVLLSKLSGQEDIIVGSPIAGRNHAEIEPLIGFFVNVLPMRSDLSENPIFADFLGQVRQTALGAYANQDYAFDKLVEVLNPVRDLSRSPVFDVVFELLEASENPFAAARSGGVVLKDISGDDPNSKFDLFATCIEGEDGMSLKFEYNSDLFNKATIERFMRYFINLMQNIVANPDKPISDIEIIDQIEKELILETFNATDIDFSKTQCINTLVSNTALDHTDNPAIIFSGKSISYEALEKRSNQLARFLISKGIDKNDHVAILSGRCPDFIIAQLAIWKAGAAFVPIDPEYPEDRVRYMIDDCGAKVLLADRRLFELVPQTTAQVISMDEPLIREQKDDPVDVADEPDAVAYTIYTSGSTGRPKGSQITHRNLHNLVFWHIDAFDVSENDRASQLAGVAFDAMIWEIWPYLVAGSTVFPLEKNLNKLLPEDLVGWFEDNRITRCFVPTKLAEVMLTLDLSSLKLKTLLTGGDRLSCSIAKHSFAVINNYGPTEATVLCTSGDVSNWDNTRGNPPIGKPIANVRVYILDAFLQPVPIGVMGEIYIGGAGVGKGYLNDKPKTAEAFIPNPFGDGSDLIYKTGDIARWLPDGTIDFVGRSDFQIEVRGYRVELGEIEAVLSSHAEVYECVVVHTSDDKGDARIIAFYAADGTFEESQCKEFLAKHIPSYMIPFRCLHIENMPITPNGKIDRNALLAMVDITSGEAVEYVAPRDEVEQSLAGFWQMELGLDQVGIYDNFFDIGGNSIRATKVVSWIRNTYNVELPLKAIFEYQTLEGFAEAVRTAIKSGEKTKYPPIEPLEKREYYEVSHAQKRLWYLDKVVPDSPFYNIPGAVLLENSKIDIDLMRKAMQAVVDRHESLRTTLKTIDGKPVQVIADTLDFEIPLIDFSTDSDPENRLNEIIDEEKLTPFNIEKGPLMRARIVKLAETSHAFLLCMHHVISDGWSMGLLVREMMTNYLAFTEGKPSPLSALEIQYRDFAHWQNQILQSELIKKQKEYWVDNLSGEFPVINLPTDHPRPAIQTQNGASRRITFNKDITELLRELARSQEVTVFMLTLAIFKVLLHKLSAQRDIIVGCPIAGRNSTQIESLIGFFVNMQPLRSDLSDNPIFADFLQQIKQVALGAYANQDYPFDKLVEVLNPVRDMSRSPIFDVVFDFHEISANPLINAKLGDGNLREITGDDRTAKFDLTVVGYEDENGIVINFVYNSDLFEPQTIDRFMEYYRNVLHELINNPQKRLSDIEMITVEERNQVLFAFNQTAREFPRDKTAQEIFYEIADKFTSKDALVFHSETMNYAELNMRSNKIARYLQDHGVARGSYVAIMVERSFDMLVGVLGILKAGAAYVPIEAEYPLARIKFMLDEIQAQVIVGHERLLEKISGYDGHMLCLEQFWKDSASIDGSNLDILNEPEDIAYVIYTSGSTGQPKGVMVPHRGITRLVINTDYADITREDKFLQVATFAFDAATMEFWGTLLNGGMLFLASSDEVLSLDSLADLVIDNDITILFLTTVLYNQLVDARPDAFTKLKRLLVGGEALSVAHVRKGLANVKPGVFANVYGPTENTTFSTCGTIISVPDNATSVPIGGPIANSTLYILDEYLNPVPVGVCGELYLGGYGLAKGYLNDLEKTTTVFVKNPIAEISDPILYKTGDLGRWLPDGRVDFIGRIDHQIKIRGHRIELGEIEDALRKSDKIDDCVVIVRELEGGNKTLIAYYVSEEDLPIDELRSDLRENLPDYMVPNVFMRIDVLPLNKNGKVDRTALPDVAGVRPEMAIEYVAPSNEIEAKIARAWEEVLGIERIGVYDNFFDLGGDSIISLQVVSSLSKDGLKLAPRDILQYQTIAELATVVDIVDVIHAQQGPVTGTSKLTPVQKWFFGQNLANQDHFNQALMFSSKQRLDEDALRKSLKKLIEHHDALRSRFKDNIQEYMPPAGEDGLKVRNLSLDSDSYAELENEIYGLQASLSLDKGPLFAAGLFHMDDLDYLVLACHHLVVDGVSWRILLQDLLDNYVLASTGQELGLPEKTTSFKEWATRLQDYAGKPEILEESSYWQKMLSGSDQDLPVDHDLGPNNVASIDVVTVEIDERNTTALLRDTHNAYNTEVNDLLITALMRSIQNWTGKNIIRIDLEGHGREDILGDVDVSRTIGWFTTIYPVILQVDQDYDLASQIKQVKETLHSIPNKGFNYGVLKYITGVKFPEDDSQISFNYLGQIAHHELDGSFQLATTDVSGIMHESNSRSYLIDVICMVRENQMKINFVYSKNRYNHETIVKVAEGFRDELFGVIAHCLDSEHFDITPSDFNLVDLDQEVIDNILDFE